MIYWVIKKNIYSKINRIVYLFEFMINAMFHLMYNKANKPTEKIDCNDSENLDQIWLK